MDRRRAARGAKAAGKEGYRQVRGELDRRRAIINQQADESLRRGDQMWDEASQAGWGCGSLVWALVGLVVIGIVVYILCATGMVPGVDPHSLPIDLSPLFQDGPYSPK